MSTAIQASSVVSIRYAAALIDLAHDSKLVEKVEKDIKSLDAMIADSADLRTLLNSPLIGRKDQASAMAAITKKAKFQTLTAKFLGLIIENNRLNALEGVIKAFYKELSKRRGEVSAQVQTAAALSAKQTKALQEAISKSVGSSVLLQTSVEPSILGGMIVTVGSHMIDDSIARKLERLRVRMSKQANQNNLKEVG